MHTMKSDNQSAPPGGYLGFWGKAQPQAGAAHPSHSVAYHCLDVAACGHVLLETHELWRRRLGDLLQLSDKQISALVTFLLALHDVGKFSKPFQIKAPKHWPESLLGPCTSVQNHLPHHDTAGWWMWRKKLEKQFPDRLLGIDDYKFDPLMKAVMGHHGTPPGNDLSSYTDDHIGCASITAARDFASDAAQLFLTSPIDFGAVKDARISCASWTLAGLTTLADWIGSNQHWFAYTAPGLSLAQYWDGIALPQARKAVARAGLETRETSRSISYGNFLTPKPGETITPGPMQEWAEKVPLTDGPGLYLIEDVTGSGKTEAALMLAHRLMAAGKADGLFFALPTQATANAMYGRLGKAYEKLFAKDAKPSLVLAHGARDLSPRFTASILGDTPQPGSEDTAGAEFADTPASAQCAAWIADDRRRAFLADVGAGTIDQALLGILPARHQALRLTGLMRRVLILDEIHAYDAYMSQEIATLLAFHNALGGSAILLSATLPHEMKSRLCAAYGAAPDPPPHDTAGREAAPYPMATIAASGALQSVAVAARSQSVREVPVKFLASPGAALERVRAAAKDGQAVLYIRNTVNDAIEACGALSDVDDLSLFHARFAFCDRLRAEEKALRVFGKSSTNRDRGGQVLIATQVVEQSLDLDFDLIVSDLAPIDLLIQRAGRLWRHERKNRPGKRELLVVSPPPVAKPDEDWLSALLPGTGAVYKDHARLWLTAKTLEDAKAIRTPGKLRHLIESVYGVDAENRIPEALQASFYGFEGQQGADKGTAKINCLKLSTGYTQDGGRWGSDEHTPTRLGDPTMVYRIARIEDGRLLPWAAGPGSNLEALHLWRLSEVQISMRLADGEAIPPELAEQAGEIRQGWGPWQDAKKLLVLRESEPPGQWSGTVRSGQKEKSIIYSPEQGLMFTG